jgi:hypothetical protein
MAFSSSLMRRLSPLTSALRMAVSLRSLFYSFWKQLFYRLLLFVKRRHIHLREKAICGTPHDVIFSAVASLPDVLETVPEALSARFGDPRRAEEFSVRHPDHRWLDFLWSENDSFPVKEPLDHIEGDWNEKDGEE